MTTLVPKYDQGGTGAVNRPINEKLAEVISVADFGAVGDNSTDDTAAIQAAINNASNYSTISFVSGKTYKTTSALTFSTTQTGIIIQGNGATIRAAHNGNGLVLNSLNETYGQHKIFNLILTGPNVAYPQTSAELPGTSTGGGIVIGYSDGSDTVAAYSNEFTNVVVQQFKYGVYMVSALLCRFFGGYYRFNQYGIYADGGLTIANYFYGVAIRENRVAGVYSSGRTLAAQANVFYGGVIETNIPYDASAGGYPATFNSTGVGVGVRLLNSYTWIFDGVYFENHNYSIWVGASSDDNKFINCRLASGGIADVRVGGIIIDGVFAINTQFNGCYMSGNSTTAANVVLNNASQLHTQFINCLGFNFIAGSLSVVPDVINNLKNQTGGGMAYGALTVPSQGVYTDSSEGTTPGFIQGVGTATATLYAYGFGSISFGTGGVGAAATNTTITTIDVGTMKNCFLYIWNYQVTRTVTIKNYGSTGAIFTNTGADLVMSAYNDHALFWINSIGQLIQQ